MTIIGLPPGVEVDQHLAAAFLQGDEAAEPAILINNDGDALLVLSHQARRGLVVKLCGKFNGPCLTNAVDDAHVRHRDGSSSISSAQAQDHGRCTRAADKRRGELTVAAAKQVRSVLFFSLTAGVSFCLPFTICTRLFCPVVGEDRRPRKDQRQRPADARPHRKMLSARAPHGHFNGAPWSTYTCLQPPLQFVAATLMARLASIEEVCPGFAIGVKSTLVRATMWVLQQCMGQAGHLCGDWLAGVYPAPLKHGFFSVPVWRSRVITDVATTGRPRPIF